MAFEPPARRAGEVVGCEGLVDPSAVLVGAARVGIGAERKVTTSAEGIERRIDVAELAAVDEHGAGTSGLDGPAGLLEVALSEKLHGGVL